MRINKSIRIEPKAKLSLRAPVLRIVADRDWLPEERKRILQSRDVYELVRPMFEEDLTIREICVLVLLNSKNVPIGTVYLSAGTINASLVSVYNVAQYCMLSNALGVILVHNHPSGNLIPSQHDLDLSNILKKGLESIKIKLLDSIILGFDSYYSLAEHGDI